MVRNRIRPYKNPKRMPKEGEIETLAATDLEEFYVEKIIGHSGTGKNPKEWKFRVRWLGYEPEDDTMLDWAAVKDLDGQLWTSIVRRIPTSITEKNTSFNGVLRN